MVIKCKSKERKKTEENVEVGEKNVETQRENVEARNENIEARKWVFFDVKGDLFAVWMRKKKFHICDTRRRYKQMLLRIVSRITERCCVDETMLI